MLMKEQIESMHTLLVRERPMGTSVAAVDELCRLAMLGLERDERQAVTSEQAAKDIKILEQIHAKSWDEAVALRHAAEALSERDERAERVGRLLIALGPNAVDDLAVIAHSNEWDETRDALLAIAAALEAP